MDLQTPREQLFDIFAESSLCIEAKIQAALELGTKKLGLSVGFLTRIDQGRQQITHVSGDHSTVRSGESCPLEEAYCRRTIEADSALAVQNTRRSEAISEAAIQRFDLGAYIGARVVTNDGTYGTVCFADHEERAEEFTRAERHFVELLADLCGNALERRAYERQLDEREEVYRAVIESSFDLVFRIDTDGEFTFVSAAIEDILGYTPDDYIGQPFTEILPDVETTELGVDIYEQVLAGHTVEEEYFPLETKTEATVFVDLRVTPIYRGEVPQAERSPEDIVGLQGMAHEATDRLRRERLVRVLNRVLRHNIRNDLNIIRGYAELLEARVSEADAENAARIVRTADRLFDLAESARRLEANLHSPPELEKMDLVGIVQRTADHIDRQYPGATIDVAAPDVAVARIAPRFETAIWELLDNAAKHGGDTPSVEVTITVTGERAVVRVADDGPGLPDIEQAVLETGEETPIAHGKGLGLWLVYWIIQTLNADISTLDTDRGTCIEIRLPAGDHSVDA